MKLAQITGAYSLILDTKTQIEAQCIARVRFGKEEQGSGRMTLSIPCEIESVGAKQTLLRRGGAREET